MRIDRRIARKRSFVHQWRFQKDTARESELGMVHTYTTPGNDGNRPRRAPRPPGWAREGPARPGPARLVC